MYPTKNSPIQITRPSARQPISGKVTSAMGLLSLVMIKADATIANPNELVAANGARPAFLENQVVADADWQAYCKADPRWRDNIRPPVPVNSDVSARFADEIQLEDVTAAPVYTDGVDGDTAAGTELIMSAGKFAPYVHATGGVKVGRLVRKVTPLADAGTFRWVIELY